MKTCENCGTKHEGIYGSGRFCSSKCARGFSTKAKRKEINEKVSNTLMNHTVSEETKEKISINNGRYWKGKKRPSLNKGTVGSNNSSKYKGVYTLKKCKSCGIESDILIFGTICDSCKGSYRIYKEACSFKFNIFDYPDLFQLPLVHEFGFYSPKNSNKPNLNGISRDHKISIKYGFKHNIDPEIISHPLNCELLRHSENSRKNTKCSISIEELINQIRSYRQMVSR